MEVFQELDYLDNMKLNLSELVLADIKTHVANELPREACGVLVVVKGKYRYIPCKNIAENNTVDFTICPEDYAAAEDLGSIVCIVHSHPYATATPSQADLVGCELSKLPWLIISWPSEVLYYWEPNGYIAPLVGREFHHGVLDCYSIIQDYYKEKLNIQLKTPYRRDKWWEKGDNLYLDLYKEWGFTQVDTTKAHDVVLMRIGSNVPNHGVIWLGDGTILHHQSGRLSSIDVYGGWFRKITSHILRHESQL